MPSNYYMLYNSIVHAAIDSSIELQDSQYQWPRDESQHFFIVHILIPIRMRMGEGDAAFVSSLDKLLKHLLCTGTIEKNWIQSYTLKPHRYRIPVDYWDSKQPTAIYADISQNHASFSDFSRGHQCAAMVMLVLAYVKTCGVIITPEELTKLIHDADKLYRHARARSDTPNIAHLRLDELLYFIKYGHHMYKAETVNNVGMLKKYDTIQTMHELITNINDLLDRDLSVSLLMQKSYYGIFKQVEEIDGKTKTKYCLFDSHPFYGVTVPPERSTKALILQFESVRHLAGHLLRTYGKLTYRARDSDLFGKKFRINMYAFYIRVDPVLSDVAESVLRADNWYIDLDQPLSDNFELMPVNRNSEALRHLEPIPLLQAVPEASPVKTTSFYRKLRPDRAVCT